MFSRSGLALTIGLAAESVRETTPLVQCVAPLGATPFVADVLYGAGARSVVTGSSGESLEAAATADALALDMSRLSADWHDGVVAAVASADAAGRPWVLDLTSLGRMLPRTERVRALLRHTPTVVRSTDGSVDGAPIEGAGALVTGEFAEWVVSGDRRHGVSAGADLLANVPGVRSAVSALIAACATTTGPFEAALAGAAWAALASERAAGTSRGPASFRIAFIDALADVRGDEIAEYLRLG